MSRSKIRTPDQNRRYKLHQKIKGRFEYHAKKRTVIVSYDYDSDDEAIKELRDRFRYNIQYTIIESEEIQLSNTQKIT
jgi:hypothetical protein